MYTIRHLFNMIQFEKSFLTFKLLNTVPMKLVFISMIMRFAFCNTVSGWYLPFANHIDEDLCYSDLEEEEHESDSEEENGHDEIVLDSF